MHVTHCLKPAPAAQVAELLGEADQEHPPTPRQVSLHALRDWVHGELTTLTALDASQAAELLLAFSTAAGEAKELLPLAAAAAAEPFQVFACLVSLYTEPAWS